MAEVGRISRLNDPEFAREVADLYIRGLSYPEMAEELDCSTDSIRNWIRDPRVQAHARREAVSRVQRITRRIDSEIDARMARVSGWDLSELLRVRKEYLERPLKVLSGEDLDTGKITNEISEAMEDSPEFAEALRQLVEAKQ